MELNPGIGHNEPPLDAEPIRDRLNEDHADLVARFNELKEAQERVPECESEEAAKRIGDYIKQLSACMKDSDGRRVKEKEPYLEGGRRVDGFFKQVKDGLDHIKKVCNAQLTDYQKEIQRVERIKLAEEAEAARKAQEEADRLAQEAADKMADENSMVDAVEKEEAAIEAAEAAAKAEKAAQQSAADLSRTRSAAGGSVSSLQTFWNFRAFDKDTIDLEKLRPHIATADLEKALRAYIKAGNRKIEGAVIFEDQKSIVR